MFYPRKQGSAKFAFIYGYVRYHRIKLKSGHEIEIRWDKNLEIYNCWFNSFNNGGLHIGQPTLRETFGQMRRVISEDINPDLIEIRARVVPDPYAWIANQMKSMIEKIVPSSVDDKILGKFITTVRDEFSNVGKK